MLVSRREPLLQRGRGGGERETTVQRSRPARCVSVATSAIQPPPPPRAQPGPAARLGPCEDAHRRRARRPPRHFASRVSSSAAGCAGGSSRPDRRRPARSLRSRQRLQPLPANGAAGRIAAGAAARAQGRLDHVAAPSNSVLGARPTMRKSLSITASRCSPDSSSFRTVSVPTYWLLSGGLRPPLTRCCRSSGTDTATGRRRRRRRWSSRASLIGAAGECNSANRLSRRGSRAHLAAPRRARRLAAKS